MLRRASDKKKEQDKVILNSSGKSLPTPLARSNSGTSSPVDRSQYSTMGSNSMRDEGTISIRGDTEELAVFRQEDTKEVFESYMKFWEAETKGVIYCEKFTEARDQTAELLNNWLQLSSFANPYYENFNQAGLIPKIVALITKGISFGGTRKLQIENDILKEFDDEGKVNDQTKAVQKPVDVITYYLEYKLDFGYTGNQGSLFGCSKDNSKYCLRYMFSMFHYKRKEDKVTRSNQNLSDNAISDFKQMKANRTQAEVQEKLANMEYNRIKEQSDSNKK